LYILDTNPISILERRGPESEPIITYLEEIPPSEIYVTVISYEEQIRGWMSVIAATKDTNAQVKYYNRLLKQLENYGNLSILPFDSASAIRFDELRKKHRRISSPDLKIAAISLVNNATLVTLNERDFRDIAGLKLESWI
jgi:tRNA(fMet)-specific endonuclease VapC